VAFVKYLRFSFFLLFCCNYNQSSSHIDKGGGGGKKSKTKLYDRTEHPQHVKDKKLKIDRQYYVETLRNPLSKLLQFVVKPEELKFIFDRAIEKTSMAASNIQSLSGFIPSAANQDDFMAQKVVTKKRKAETLQNTQIQKSLKNFF
jgi:hypothetical protein